MEENQKKVIQIEPQAGETVMVDPVNACSLHGSFETCLTARDIVPLFHGTAGCPCYMWLTMVSNPTYRGLSELKFPTTCLRESDIVYGGEKRLEANIAQAVERYHPKLILVIASCTPSIIGDDIQSVARRMSQRYEIPIVAVDARSARWDHREGRVAAQKALIKGVMRDRGIRRPNTVNILGLYPGDYNWRGDLREIRRLLEGIGVEVNAFFPAVEELEELLRVPEASLNLVLSAECGLEPAQELERSFGIPYRVALPPYGLSGTAEWLRTVGQALGLEEGRVEEFIRKEAREVADTIVPHFTSFGQVRLLRGIPTALFGDGSRLAGLVGFIARELGMKPVLVGLKTSAEASRERLEQAREALGLNFLVLEQVRSIEEIVRAFESTRVDFLFASDLESKLAGMHFQIGAFVGISSPIFFKYNVTYRPYMGYRGTVYLFEEIMNARMQMYQSHRPYGSFWDLPD